MKTIIEALKFCKENELYSPYIKIALGASKVPLTFKEGFNQLRMKK